jgi:hypothetical protein
MIEGAHGGRLSHPHLARTRLIVVHTIRPGQSLTVATVLAILPYLIIRGLTNRPITWLRHSPLQYRTKTGDNRPES